MPKKQKDTIENRVYLFESLASSYVAAAAELIGSDDEKERGRAMRALADLAFVSCVVADTGSESAEAVRELINDRAREEKTTRARRTR